MQLFVKAVNGRTFSVIVTLGDTVDSVKKQIETKEGTLVENQRLLFGGKQLEDGHTLEEYNVWSEATLHLVYRLPGGSVDN